MFKIAIKDLKIMIRDSKALLIMLAMPLTLIFILGNALGGLVNNNIEIGQFTVGVVNKDNGLYSQIFLNEYLRSEDVHKVMNVFAVDENKGIEMLKNKVAPAIIIIPQNFSENINKGIATKVEILAQPDNNIKSHIVKGYVSGYFETFSTMYSGAKVLVNEFEREGVNVKPPFKGLPKELTIISEIAKKSDISSIQFKEANQKENKSISMIQYYSAGMLAMFILFGCVFGSKSLLEERENNTLNRVLSTGLSKNRLLIGKFIGFLIIGVLQALAIMLLTWLFFKVSWGSSIAGLLLLAFSGCFAAAGMTIMIAGISKSSKSAAGFASLLIQLMSMLGGSMIPIYLMPKGMEMVSSITINKWLIKGFTDIMLGGGVNGVLTYVAILLVIGTIFTVIGMSRFRI